MKIALVTGAYKGLGFEWCKQLAKLNYTIILTARDIEKAYTAAEILKKNGATVHTKALEVSNENELAELANWLEITFGKLDLLINNAGINSMTRAKGDKTLINKNLSLENIDANEVLNMIHINAIAPILTAKHFKSLLSKSQQGKIIHIGSWLGSISNKKTGGNYSYAVSKSALNMMNRALAFDIIKDNIISVVVNPGWVQTDMGGDKAQFTTEQAVEQMIENVLNKITINDTGKFFNFDGTEHPF